MDSQTTTQTTADVVITSTNGLSSSVVVATEDVVNDNNNTINENNNEVNKKVKYETNNEHNLQNQNQNDLNHNQRPPPQPQQQSQQLNNNSTLQVKSRVVHVRNIPVDTSDVDLIALTTGFGRVTNCLILRGKSQAFIEFSDANCAQQMVNYWQQTTLNGMPAPMQPTIRGRHVFCQLSNHKELKTNNSHVMHNNEMNAMLSSTVVSQQSRDAQQAHDGNGNGMASSAATNGREPSCVLRVIVENQIYAVSLEVLHSVFSRAGKVAKIVTFQKNGSFQALIQFCDPRDAQTAKALLDGQNLFHHSNCLRIEFSKLQQLNVKYNNDKSRDYSNPSLPTIGSSQSAHDVMAAAAADQSLMNSILSHGQQQHHSAHAQHSQSQHSQAQQLFNPFAVNQSVQALRALHNPLHALNALQSQSLGQLGAHLGLGGQHGVGGQQLHQNGLSSVGQHGLQSGQSSVLLVSNLNENTTTTDQLFTLFGVYGDVIRVKILFNKKDNALIQMAEPAQAQLAQTYLDKVKLGGRVIRVTPSKHQLVQMPKEGQHDAGLTKDFSQSALHRFKKPGSKNYGNIYPPSATLHLSNIPSTISEEDIKQAFGRELGSAVVAFKFFPKDRKMALIQLNSIEESIQALIKMHNYQLSESSHLRVSFSKSSI